MIGDPPHGLLGSGGVSIEQALAAARAKTVDRFDAQSMLGQLLQRPRGWLVAHGDATLTADQSTQFFSWLERLAAGEPLAYLLGEQAFHGLLLHVEPGVLIPRSDTELLVDWGLEVLQIHARQLGGRPSVIDLGTGSGAIALAIKQGQPSACVTAVDSSQKALDVTARNAAACGLSVERVLGHWWSAVQGRRFHLAVSNPPYIAPEDPHLKDLTHEPRAALVAQGEGLADLHAIIDGAADGLEPGGWLLLEHGFDQAATVRRRLIDARFRDVQTRRDLGGRERCTGGRTPEE